MALLSDVERIAIIRAQRQKGRGLDGEQRLERVQVLGD
jgi:hypothetical protein